MARTDDAIDMPPPTSAYPMALRAALRGSDGRLARFEVGDLTIEIVTTSDSVFVIVRRPGAGGLAVRTAFVPVAFDCKAIRPKRGELARLRVTSAIGEHAIGIVADRDALERLRIVTDLTPAQDMVLPFAPRDLYPLGRGDDPAAARGMVDASQRGINTGLLYFHIDEPAFGTILYVQNLTASNAYFRATGTTPREVVGGAWPELGYALPTASPKADPGDVALAAGKAVTLSDAILVFRHDTAPHERESARLFVQMLGAAYRMLDLPAVDYRDWMGRADRSARDLDEAPEATIRHYGHRYVHPYTGAEYPDVMVQMSVITALHDWGRWRGEPHPLEAELKAGLHKFHDRDLGTLRRYLPNVGKEKDADAIDSWYLYHPMVNLGILPPDAIADTQRDANGHVDRTLSFPLEDLYPDGQPAGQVGQEVYGAGAAFIFASRAFHRIADAPFVLFCDNLLRAIERTGDRALTVLIDGGETSVAALRLIRQKRRRLPDVTLITPDGDTIRARATTPDRIDFDVPANGRLILTWD